MAKRKHGGFPVVETANLANQIWPTTGMTSPTNRGIIRYMLDKQRHARRHELRAVTERIIVDVSRACRTEIEYMLDEDDGKRLIEEYFGWSPASKNHGRRMEEMWEKSALVFVGLDVYDGSGHEGAWYDFPADPDEIRPWHTYGITEDSPKPISYRKALEKSWLELDAWVAPTLSAEVRQLYDEIKARAMSRERGDPVLPPESQDEQELD